MMAPYDAPQMSKIISSLTTRMPIDTNSFNCERAIGYISLSGVDDGSAVLSPRTLWYPRAYENDYKELKGRITYTLRECCECRECWNERLTVALLYMLYVLTGDKCTAEHIVMALESVGHASVMQMNVFPVQAPDYLDQHDGEYRFCSLDIRKVTFKCDKAMCDYFDLYGSSLHGRLTLERKSIFVMLPNIYALLEQLMPDHRRWRDVYDEIRDYHATVAGHLFGGFWQAFDEAQWLPAALHGISGYSSMLRIVPNQTELTIFTFRGKYKYTFVAPGGRSMFIEMPVYALRNQSWASRVVENSKFDGFTHAHIHQTLRSFVKFLFSANIHCREGRYSDGLLHRVIALDMLLGDKQNTQKNVAERAAILTHKQLSMNYDCVRHRLIEIYDARSDYVHDGKAAADEHLSFAEVVCKEMTLVLLRLQSKEENYCPNFRQVWLKNIDYVVKAIEADQPVTNENWIALGVSLEKSELQQCTETLCQMLTLDMYSDLRSIRSARTNESHTPSSTAQADNTTE